MRKHKKVQLRGERFKHKKRQLKQGQRFKGTESNTDETGFGLKLGTCIILKGEKCTAKINNTLRVILTAEKVLNAQSSQAQLNIYTKQDYFGDTTTDDPK